MVKRIVFGLLWTGIGILMLALRDTLLLVCFLSALCVIATHELNHAVKLQNKPVMILSMVASAIVPFYYEFNGVLHGTGLNFKAEYLVCLYILTLCIFMLFEYEKTKFSHIATVAIGSLGVPFAITRLMWFRDVHEHFPEQNYNENHGLFRDL